MKSTSTLSFYLCLLVLFLCAPAAGLLLLLFEAVAAAASAGFVVRWGHLRSESLLLAREVLALALALDWPLWWLCWSPPLPLPLPASPFKVLDPAPRIARRTTEISSSDVGVGGALLPFNLLSTLSSLWTNRSTSDWRIPNAAAAVRYGCSRLLLCAPQPEK